MNAMIKPYYKTEDTPTYLEVEDHGIINVNELPIRVYPEKKGYYCIDFAQGHHEDGESYYILSEMGGANAMSFGGMHLGVIREIRD